MAEKRSTFQTIVFGVFIAFVVIAVLVFATFSGGGGGQSVGQVVLWGTYDQALVQSYLNRAQGVNNDLVGLRYEEIPAERFHETLVEALANGTGPDLFILDQANILRHEDKILPFSYEGMSQRELRDTFIDQGEMFAGADGIIALPFSIDPLVLYWNRDLFAAAGVAQPPAYWDEFFALAERITVRDSANTISRATIAFGEFDNVAHAKDIIAALIMQAGGSIVERAPSGDLTPALSTSAINFDATFAERDVLPAQRAVRFYTEFADPVKSVYTWNRSLPYSLDAFAQGTLAMYVGYASEVRDIQARNPNLNFDVAPLPQIRSGERTRRLTFGTLSALAIPRTAANVYGASQLAFSLASTEGSRLFAETISVPSPRRDVLRDIPDDPLQVIFRDAALMSRAWLDPLPSATDAVFRRMIGDATSGALRITDTVQRANEELRALLTR